MQPMNEEAFDNFLTIKSKITTLVFLRVFDQAYLSTFLE